MTQKANGFWIATSDLMSGLMVIFLFIAVVYMYEIKDVDKRVARNDRVLISMKKFLEYNAKNIKFQTWKMY